MKPVLVFGATGYTGRLVTAALDSWLEYPYIIAGRSQQKLERLKESLQGDPEIRVADPTRPETLKGLFDGVGAVANTVGPFRKLGRPVVEAAIEAKVHYVDTTGEQAFQLDIRDSFDAKAQQNDVAVITGQAYEYAPGYCAGHILNERFGPISSYDAFYLVRKGAASRGTMKSALGMLQEQFYAYHNGELIRAGGRFQPTWVDLYGEERQHATVPFPGGDGVLLPREIDSIQNSTCSLVLPPKEARVFALIGGSRPLLRAVLKRGLGPWLEKKISASSDPTTEQRQKADWAMIARARSGSGVHHFRADGPDPYRITGDICALGAVWLAQAKGRCTGVVTTGWAFHPGEFLDALKERGVTWKVE